MEFLPIFEWVIFCPIKTIAVRVWQWQLVAEMEWRKRFWGLKRLVKESIGWSVGHIICVTLEVAKNNWGKNGWDSQVLKSYWMRGEIGQKVLLCRTSCYKLCESWTPYSLKGNSRVFFSMWWIVKGRFNFSR